MLNLQELYNLIERLEYEQYKLFYEEISRKAYSKIRSERRKIIAEDLRNKHTELSAYYSFVQTSITQDFIEAFIKSYENHSYEPIDFITVRHSANCINFITDDSDFRNDSSINVYFYREF